MIRDEKSTQQGPEQRLFADPEALKELVTVMVQTILNEEQARFLGAGPYERSQGRRGHRNGTKPRSMKTRVGKIGFEVPQVRGAEEPFRPSLFERFQRTEKALLVTLQEMYVKGVSTREVAAVMEQMGGFEVSAQAVSQAAAQLDEAVKRWRERELEGAGYPYMVIDARYEKVRKNGRVVSQAVLIAAGVDTDGRREILGFWPGDSESEDTWGEVFRDLKARGLSGVELLVSDAHKGMRKAATKHLQNVGWQRCRVHFLREMQAKVSWRDRRALATDLKEIYASAEVDQCLLVAEEVAAKWEARSLKLANAIRSGVEDTLTVAAMDLPSEHRRRLHSTNVLERLNRELKKRTRKVSIFPNEASLVRLYGAMLMEIDERWQTEERRFVNMERRGK
jgi:putative transposase